ncbi:PqqD family peptide modification chaperone [Clostridium thermarum]|uniref:PqqD family peptide modification chaperone n=1 Tax=Clostridium thermarum TaxID=1716543 RepID=UPI0013D39914|nr:PqqD family peptide modification chaperone [Clostridium thermarum]
MNLDFSKKYKFDRDFEVLKRENNYLYVDYENVNWFRTNNTGHEIITLCDGERTMEEVLTKIADIYQFDVNFLKRNFEGFIKDAIENRLLLEADSEKERLVEYSEDKKIGTLWIHVSSLCNLECPFCYSRSGSGQNQKLETDDIVKFLDSIEEDKRSQISIVISGGEPFLYKDLPKLVASIKERGINSIHIITNGTVGEEMYEEVIPLIESIQISVDGTIPEYHDITRGKGSFEKMINKFKLIRNISQNVGIVISFTPTKYNIDDMPNIPQFAFDNNINAIHLTRLMPVGRGKDNMEHIVPETKVYEEKLGDFLANYQRVNALVNIKRETQEILLDESQKTKFIALSFAGDQSRKVTYRSKKTICGAGLGSMSINYDGYIYPCASLHLKEYSLGHIKENSIEEIFDNTINFMGTYCVDKKPGCKVCKLKYFCGGGCMSCGLSHTGDLLGSDPMCDYYKEAMIEVMWQYRMQKS